MRRRVIAKRAEARLDLIEIGIFIAEGNSEAADRFLDDLEKTSPGAREGPPQF